MSNASGQVVDCPECGRPNRRGARFCAHCRHEIPATPRPEPVPAPTPRPVVAQQLVAPPTPVPQALPLPLPVETGSFPLRTEVTDFRIPFMSIVIFRVKWVLATLVSSLILLPILILVAIAALAFWAAAGVWVLGMLSEITF